MPLSKRRIEVRAGEPVPRFVGFTVASGWLGAGRRRLLAVAGGALAAELLGALVGVRGVVVLAEHAHVRAARVLLLLERALLDLDLPVGAEDPVFRVVGPRMRAGGEEGRRRREAQSDRE